ncbi:MAG: metal ABC transporter substrate-binding protein [Clostridiales bacterium]|nr:metal ABC transporter substrate-binding protein [Clostridiales bacterium]
MKKIVCLLAALAVMICAFSACGVSENGGGNKLNVVCALFPQYDFVREIAGEKVNNRLLLPPGTESHAFEPTPSDIISLNDADLFIYIGDNMETWAPSVLSETDEEKTTVLNIASSLGMRLAEHEHDHEHEKPETEESKDVYDPHIWTDPVTVKKIVRLIADTLSELDPDNASFYNSNADIYIGELEKLDSDIRSVVDNAKRKEIIFGSRFAIKNFTDEYGLTHLAAFDSCTEETEPSAAAVARIIDEVKEKNIPVIFYEELIEPRAASDLAEETGTTALLFHSCHNLSKNDLENGETYLSLMDKNVENLRIALS